MTQLSSAYRKEHNADGVGHASSIFQGWVRQDGARWSSRVLVIESHTLERCRSLWAIFYERESHAVWMPTLLRSGLAASNLEHQIYARTERGGHVTRIAVSRFRERWGTQ